ncbi:MAG: hypothetical protein WD872_19185 [Pirellulaceae bacterium]
MLKARWTLFAPAIVFFFTLSGQFVFAQETRQGNDAFSQFFGETPKELPPIPAPNPQAAVVPSGFQVDILKAGLVYPTSVELADDGSIYIAEAGYAYNDQAAPARVLRFVPQERGFQEQLVTDDLNGPVNDILWHRGLLYISHRGKISVADGSGRVRDLVTGLPSLGDHHNNGLAAAPDGKIYFAQGVATNSGVVGIDNFQFGWLKQHPDVHDIPAKDIKLRPATFETPDPIAFLN